MLKLRRSGQAGAEYLANSMISRGHAHCSWSGRERCWIYIRFYIIMAKPIYWVGSARAALQAFAEEARRQAGQNLWLVQTGEHPRDWRPMPDVASGVIELRIHAGTEHRVFYVANFNEAVYVLHAFEKRRETTSQHDLEIGRRRYREVIAKRAARPH